MKEKETKFIQNVLAFVFHFTNAHIKSTYNIWLGGIPPFAGWVPPPPL
jgi:hypothetical protein